MNNTRAKTVRLVYIATLFALILTMALVPQLGMIMIPGLAAINLLLIPVAIAAINLGKWYGAAASTFMGVMSLVLAFTRASGVVDLAFRDPLVSIVARIPVGFVIYYVYAFFKKAFARSRNNFTREALPMAFGAAAGALANTALVMLMLTFNVLRTETFVIYTAFLSFLLNLGFEVALLVIIVPPVALALNKVLPMSRFAFKGKPKPAAEYAGDAVGAEHTGLDTNVGTGEESVTEFSPQRSSKPDKVFSDKTQKTL